MPGTKLHWVEGRWSGKLALSARPRGGDWLDDEMARWESAGVNTVISLLEPEEERELDLSGERDAVQAHGMGFRSIPIADRQVPSSRGAFTRELEDVLGELKQGRNVALHCRQGVGRTGLVAACLLLLDGEDPAVVIERLSKARGVPVPDTAEQAGWIERFAASFAAVL